MTKREIVHAALRWERPAHVPWNFGFTYEAREKLVAHYGTTDLDPIFGNHILGLGGDPMDDIGGGCWRDTFGVVWDRSIDRDIGTVTGCVLSEPTLEGYEFPNPVDDAHFADITPSIERDGDLFRIFQIGFSLYERAWTLRGMENLLVDFHENPAFVRDLLRTIADWNIVRVTRALGYDVDAVYYGDDWGQQRGLQMGPGLWREFLLPELRRMYGVVRDAGRLVFIHSCGDVDELFDDLVDAGVNCFNPFQPEVMDTEALMRHYRGRLAFHGGLSTQQTLPYGTPDEVRAKTRRLLELGRDGGYIFAPAHAVEGDVALENMLAFIDELHAQAG